MDAEDVLLIGAAAFALYLATRPRPWNDDVGLVAAEQAGFDTWKASAIDDGANYVGSGETTYKFLPGDFAKLNFAQRTLISLDKIVPGTWLSRLALE